MTNAVTVLTTSKNLYQRLSAITAEIKAISPTGKTAFKTPALSIADVEDALRELLAKHGIVTGYTFLSKPEVVTTNMWMVNLRVFFFNADKPDDKMECDVFDIGNSPSGAVSFALKRLFRAVFHLADADEEGVPRERKTAQSEAPGNGAGTGAPSQPPLPTPRDTLLLKISTLGAVRYGKAWRESVQALARSIIAREFKLVSDLSADELDLVVAELEQAP